MVHGGKQPRGAYNGARLECPRLVKLFAPFDILARPVVVVVWGLQSLVALWIQPGGNPSTVRLNTFDAFLKALL